MEESSCELNQPNFIKDQINRSLEDLNNTNKYNLGSISDVTSLLEDLNTDDYWDDLFAKLPAGSPNTIAASHSNKARATDGLSVIAECGEAYERLYENQEKLLEFMAKEEGVVESTGIQESSSTFDSIKQFSASPSYWNDVVKMESENNSPVVSKLQSTESSIMRDLGVKESLEIIGTCANAQEALNVEIEEVRKLCKADGTTEVDLCTKNDDKIIEPSSVDDIHSEELQIMLSQAQEEFYPELLAMQEEANANGPTSISMVDQITELPIQQQQNQTSYIPLIDTGDAERTNSGTANEKKNKGESNDERSREGLKPLAEANKNSNTTQPTTIITTTSVWEDLKVVVMQPHEQISIDNKIVSSENPILLQMQEEINLRALRGPNIKYSFSILLIAAISIGLVSYSNSVRESPWLFRILWALAYAINIIAVSIPGRLDRVLVGEQHIKPWQSLFEAATWAFALWGIVYGSEILLSGYVTIIGIPMKLFQKLVPYWLASNWFQGLWCFAFRPEFKAHLWVPSVFLALGTYAFSMMHLETTAFLRSFDDGAARYGILLLRIPFGIHATWLAAATLLNVNSYVAVAQSTKGMQIAVAHLSAAVAAAFGVFFAVYTNDCFIAFTAAWALQAVAQRSAEKARSTTNNTMFKAEIHESIATTGNLLSNVTKCVGFGILLAPFVGSSH